MTGFKPMGDPFAETLTEPGVVLDRIIGYMHYVWNKLVTEPESIIKCLELVGGWQLLNSDESIPC